MTKYYAVKNSYGSETSTGFSNTWKVLCFYDRDERDEFVNTNSHDLSVKAIKKSEIGKYIDKPKPFSGQALCVVNTGNEYYTVQTAYRDESAVIDTVN